MKGRMTDPPKKKHPNRPRPEPIPALTDAERALKSGEEFRKALMHLREAEAIVEACEAPNAVAHPGYYAMLHCASAALYAKGGVGKRGDVPQSHEHIIQHYAKVTVGLTDEMEASGRDLNAARTDRERADYGLDSGIDMDEARSIVVMARKFIDLWAATLDESALGGLGT
jgi:uncharacterized protein (UPF0332 family)